MQYKEIIKEAIKEALFEYDTYKEERKKNDLPQKISKNQVIKLKIMTRGKLEKLIDTGRIKVERIGTGDRATMLVETKKLMALKDLII